MTYPKTNGFDCKSPGYPDHPINKTPEIIAIEKEIADLKSKIETLNDKLISINQNQFNLQYGMESYKTKVISKGWTYTYIGLFQALHGYIKAIKDSAEHSETEILSKWEKAD